jgi:hypothetical protein
MPTVATVPTKTASAEMAAHWPRPATPSLRAMITLATAEIATLASDAPAVATVPAARCERVRTVSA